MQGSQEVHDRHPRRKKGAQTHKQKQLKRVDAIKEMCLITFHSLHSWWQKSWFFHNILMNDRFLHFGCFSIVIGSLKPSYSFFFLINTSSFQSCLMFSMTTFKVEWSLNNLENHDILIVLDTCCLPPSCLVTKTGE